MLLAHYHTISQFEQGESDSECGPFAVALNKFAGPRAPVGVSEEVDQLADRLWNTFPHSSGGIGVPALLNMLGNVGLRYQKVGSFEGNDHIENLTHEMAIKWLRQGYPLICTANESNVIDLDLGASPYPWLAREPFRSNPPNHIFTLVGIADDGNVLVADPANRASFPRRYQLSRLRFITLVAVILPWKQPSQQGEITMGIPAGWHDDGKVLSAPNGHKVVKGFRQHILDKGWDPGNLPLGEEFPLSQLEDSNPALGGGTQQIFRWTVLEWTQKDNTVREMWTGQELMKVREEKNALAQQVQSLQAQLSALQGQIKQHP